jgi:hypothetical protein
MKELADIESHDPSYFAFAGLVGGITNQVLAVPSFSTFKFPMVLTIPTFFCFKSSSYPLIT